MAETWRCPTCGADPSDPAVPDYCLGKRGRLTIHRDGVFEVNESGDQSLWSELEEAKDDD